MSCPSCPDVPSAPPVSYTLPDCPGGSPCEEYTFADCTKYTGPNLPALGVTNGMNLKSVLVALNNQLFSGLSKTYTVTVSPSQTTTVVEYISDLGNLVSISVSSAQSPQSFCAMQNSPVKISGTGVLSSANVTCGGPPN